MFKTIIKSAVTIGLLTVGLFVSAPVAALDWPAPAEYRSIDQNGVDMAQGTVIRSFPGLAGSGGLGHTLIIDNQLDPLNNFMDNFTGGLGLNRDETSPSSRVNIYIGNHFEVFTGSGPTYTPRKEVGTTLTSSGSTYTYTRKDGTVITFDGSKVGKHAFAQTHGIITKITSPNGRVLDFYYNVHSSKYRLQSVVSSDGYQLHYVYGSAVQPTSITSFNRAYDTCSPTATSCSFSNSWPQVTYTVAGSGNARTITAAGAANGSVIYDFEDSSGYLSHIKPVGSTYTTTRYDYAYREGARRVIGVTNIAHNTTYVYTGWSSSNPQVPTLTVTRPQFGTDIVKINLAEGYIYNKTTHDVKVEYNQAFNNYVTSSEQVTTLEITSYEYDDRNNATTTTRAGGGISLTLSATYPASCSNVKTCNKPTTSTNAGGKVTNYSYHSSSGMVAKVTAPAVGGINPETRYTYAQKYAWIKNGGSYAQVSTPIWVLTGTSSCSTGAASGNGCATASDEVSVTYEYETGNSSTPSNLRVKGVVVTADGQTRRTCFGYDKVGNKIYETSPLGTSGSCS